ncbi:MAG TPA: Uma2 family endonuclease [Pyrinomonadaceae bacterium]|jgi:Uma2 family endonuclease|nr:Uma2 family endonuclease [Pyrinomonadaceae bacterium]
MSTTISNTENLLEMIERMPPDSVLTQHGVSWDDYEELLESVSEASGLRISYADGTLQIMTVSFKHEKFVRTIERMVDLVSLRLRIKVLFYGSATMKQRHDKKAAEPDACFYVEKAELVGTKDEFDLTTDPPPDVVVEIDLHHDSSSKLPIYAALGVPEIWRYEGQVLTIHRLSEGKYVATEGSESLPLFTGAVLTEFLRRIPKQDQYDILLAFEAWLKAKQG